MSKKIKNLNRPSVAGKAVLKTISQVIPTTSSKVENSRPDKKPFYYFSK